jgi:PAS domain S-box-containing protein
LTVPLRILWVDDSPDDAALLQLELRRADFDVEWHRVETAAELRDGLHRFKPTVILSDYTPRDLSAAAALRVVQESGLDIPFIVVSGTAGEDRAVEMLKAGARDYVMKANLARLGEVIRRELKVVLIRADRNEVETALRKSQRYLERAQEIARLGSWVYTLDGSEPMLWSKETYRILGLKPDAYDGNPETFFSFTHPEDRDKVSQARQLAIQGEAAYHLDHRVVLRDGSARWVHEEAVVERDPSGKPRRMVGAVMDITDRKESEEELRRSETMFARLAECGVIGILICDGTGCIQDANETVLKMLGYSRGELLGNVKLSQLTPTEWWPIDELVLEQLKTKGSAPFWEKEFLRKDGSRVPVLIGMAMLDPLQRINFVLDITERKRLEKEQRKSLQLQEQTALAEEANQFKSKFLANMSHELRTPLNAVIGFSELLDQEIFGPLLPRQKEYVQNILASGQHLLSLVNDVLDISKVEAGRMELVREWTSLATVTESVDRILQSLARKKRVTLKLSLPEDLPDVFIDPIRMKQVLYNLLANGIKFTPEGGVVGLSVHLEGSQLHLSVDDTGIGIQEDQLSRLFRPFEQIRNGAGGENEGTGLGLALTKSLVELHGGTISVRSEVGKGSSFQVSLPMRTAALSDFPVELETIAEDLILVVGNDAGACELLARHIRALGFAVAVAGSSESGLQLACELRPVAIILDLQTPQIDEGWAMVKRVKNHPAIVNVPVIVFSVVPEPNRALYLGAMDYLVKPQTRDDLTECLSRVGVKTYSLDGLRVLLVGKFNADLATLATNLRDAGCHLRATTRLDPYEFAQQPVDLVVANVLLDDDGLNLGAAPGSLPILSIVDAPSPGSGNPSKGATEVLRADGLRAERLVRLIKGVVRGIEPDALASRAKLLAHIRAAILRAEGESKRVAVISARFPQDRAVSIIDWIAAVKSRLRPGDFLALAGENDLALVAYGVDEDAAARLSQRLKDLLWTVGKLRPSRIDVLWYPANGNSAEDLMLNCDRTDPSEARP